LHELANTLSVLIFVSSMFFVLYVLCSSFFRFLYFFSSNGG